MEKKREAEKTKTRSYKQSLMESKIDQRNMSYLQNAENRGVAKKIRPVQAENLINQLIIINR